jgi:hypothetical protein
LLGAAVLALACFGTAPASASTFDVDALANSSSGGTGLSTISLSIGQAFSVSVDPNDLWNAGDLPRWSNADGLTHDLFATGTDDSGQPAGTLIGKDFGLYTQGVLSAPYGTLVGRIGGGAFFAIGTSYSGVAATAGTLEFFYWDSNNYDNTEFVTATLRADVNAGGITPIPGALPLFATGLGALGVLGWRRKRKPARAG